jgi:divalent metal cation (Fe/Co/Zn/Cd) transporter
MNLIKKGIYVEIVSIFWMVIEAVVALSAGIATHSLSLEAFGMDSIIELISGSVLLWRLWIQMKEQCVEKLENAEKFASWVVGIALLSLAVYIFIAAMYNLFRHSSAETSIIGIALAIVAGIVMPFLSWAKIMIGNKIGSNSLRADGYCSIVCAYMSWILLIGVILTAVYPRLWWIDSIISLAFIYFVVKEGVEAIQKARGEVNCNRCK